jgi:hypothetical protein
VEFWRIETPSRFGDYVNGHKGQDGSGHRDAIRAYRKAVSCLVEVGDFPAYGRDGPIGGGEESAFRMFAERGTKR